MPFKKGLANTTSYIEKYINTAYDEVKTVYDNLASIIIVAAQDANITEIASVGDLAVLEANMTAFLASPHNGMKDPVVGASTINVALTGLQTIDGVSLTAGMRFLAKNQTDPIENGIYLVAAAAWTRASDWDNVVGVTDVSEGTTVPVSRGTVNALTYWTVSTTAAIVVGTTAVTIIQGLTNIGIAATTTVIDDVADATSFPVFMNAATGDNALKSDAAKLKYNAVTGQLDTSIINTSGNAVIGGNSDVTGTLLKGGVDINNISPVSWQANTLLGAALTIIADRSNICYMTPTDIVWVDNAVGDIGLTWYRFNGSAWIKIGASFDLGGVGVQNPSVARLTSSTFAIAENDKQVLQAYKFDQSVFTQIGNDSAALLNSTFRIASLNITDIALTKSTASALETWRFDGENWRQVGNTFTIANGGYMCALNEYEVAISNGVALLSTYRFDGSDWVKIGATFDPTFAAGIIAMESLHKAGRGNGDEIVCIDGVGSAIKIFSWNGNVWSLKHSESFPNETSAYTVAVMNNRDIATFSAQNNLLEMYRITDDVNGTEPFRADRFNIEYETGTWLPSIGGTTPSYGFQNGWFTRIGRQMIFGGRIALITIGDGSTSLVSNFPYPAGSLSIGAVTITQYSGLTGAPTSLTGRITVGSSNFQMHEAGVATVMFKDGSEINFTGTYYI